MNEEVSIESVDKFYDFLQGVIPNNMRIKNPLKLSPEQAFLIIWYLKEELLIIPDKFEKCHNCDGIVDSYEEGFRLPDEDDDFYCDGCMSIGEAPSEKYMDEC